MSEFNYPLELKDLADYHPHEHISTGYEVIDLTFLNVMAQSEDGYGLAGNANNDDYLPSAQFGESGSASLATTDVDILYVLLRQVLGEAWQWVVGTLTSATWSDIADYDFFEWAVINYRYGLRRQHIYALQQDCSTAATTITHHAVALCWDDVGVGTTDMHTDWIKRVFYSFGIRDSKHFPDLTDSIKDSGTQTSWNRISEIMCVGVIMEIIYFFIIGALQSDRFVWALGSQVAGLLPKKVDVEALQTALPEQWATFTKPFIHDALGTSLDDPEGYDGMATAYGAFDFSLVDLAAMDPFSQRLNTVYRVPTPALVAAREIFGGGRYEVAERGNYETVNYALLLNLAEPSGGGYTAHGISKWYLGPNTAIGIDLLEDLRRLEQDFNALLRKKHWTWFDIIGHFSDFWTDFNCTTSISGFSNPAVYKAILRQFGAFADSGKSGSNGLLYYSDANIQSTHLTQLDTGAWNDDGAQDHENWYLHLLIWLGQDPRDNLYLGSSFDNITELQMDLILQLFFHCGDALADDHKVIWYRQRYVEMIDFRDGSHYCWATGKDDKDIPRMEAYSNYLETATLYNKYGIWIGSTSPTFARTYSDYRPKGYVGRHHKRIERYGDPDVKIQLLDACMSLFGTTVVESNSPVEITDKPKTEPKAPAENAKAKEPVVVEMKDSPKGDSKPPSEKPPIEGGSDEDT